jgi:phosphoglycerate dehydrogenase-like enzyme
MTSTARPTVVVTEGSDPKPLQWLSEQANVISMRADVPEFPATLATADGLLVRTYTKVNEAFLAGAPKLRVVGRGGVGLENIDVAACRKRGIEVVFTPDANTLAVGDFLFGNLLRLIRQWSYFHDDVLEPREFKHIRDTLRGRQLNEMSIGILGMGRVGRRVGHIAANGFGMRVLYNDVVDVHSLLDFPAESVSKDVLYSTPDVLSLHVDMRPGNELLVGKAAIEQMKPGSILINTSRGEVLDIDAVAEAIRTGHLAGCAIDVFDPEPPKPGFPLLGFDNVLLTPHLAARTYAAMENMSWVVRDVMAVLNGQPPRYPAPKSRG